VKLFRSKFLHLVLAVGALLGQLPAQVGNPASADSWTEDRSNLRADDSGADSGPGGGAPAAADLVANGGMSFVIPGVINLGELNGGGILFGGGISQGYGWVHNNAQGNPNGSISVVQPYAGLFQTGHRHGILLEYSPTVDLFNQHRWDGSVLQRAGIRGFEVLSERWRWFFSGYTTYGTEYLRQLGGVAMGDYPGWLTFSEPTETRLLAMASTGLNWHRKPQQDFSLIVSDAYSSVRQGPHYDAGSVRAQGTSYFGRDSSWHVYAQAHRYSNQPGCTRLGAGGGFVWNTSKSTTLSLEGGPEYGSGPCVVHLTSSFSGYLAQRISPRTVFYLSAARDLVEPYLLQSRWTDIFSAKLWQKTGQNTHVTAGAGYAHSTSIAGEVRPFYRGFLLFSEFHWNVSNSVSFVGSYRYFRRDAADVSFQDRQSWVFCSLVWHPVSRAIHRSY
jgi:hypothetical protein